MPGHLYMHQRQHPTVINGAGSMGQERVRADDEAQDLDFDEHANGEGTYNECTQMGSDDSDRDFDPETDSESGDESSSSENSGHESKESSVDDDDDEWGVESMYED